MVIINKYLTYSVFQCISQTGVCMTTVFFLKGKKTEYLEFQCINQPLIILFVIKTLKTQM